MTDFFQPDEMLLHWHYWPEKSFLVENPKPETEFSDEFLSQVVVSGLHQGVTLRADDRSCPAGAEYDDHQHSTPSLGICWHGWILHIDADNGRYAYRIGDYLPEVNRWSARWPD